MYCLIADHYYISFLQIFCLVLNENDIVIRKFIIIYTLPGTGNKLLRLIKKNRFPSGINYSIKLLRVK